MNLKLTSMSANFIDILKSHLIEKSSSSSSSSM